MKTNFSQNIKPYVLNELSLAKIAKIEGKFLLEFRHLENAHVLGQASTYWHTKVHLLMLM